MGNQSVSMSFCVRAFRLSFSFRLWYVARFSFPQRPQLQRLCQCPPLNDRKKGEAIWFHKIRGVLISTALNGDASYNKYFHNFPIARTEVSHLSVRLLCNYIVVQDLDMEVDKKVDSSATLSHLELSHPSIAPCVAAHKIQHCG